MPDGADNSVVHLRPPEQSHLHRLCRMQSRVDFVIRLFLTKKDKILRLFLTKKGGNVDVKAVQRVCFTTEWMSLFCGKRWTNSNMDRLIHFNFVVLRLDKVPAVYSTMSKRCGCLFLTKKSLCGDKEIKKSFVGAF
jgi:hypothetical protein